jgi:hybrid cluster-associated redox disulfide protein
MRSAAECRGGRLYSHSRRRDALVRAEPTSDPGWVEMADYTRETLIRDVLTEHADATRIFESYGLGCAVCLGADMETLASVATMHEIPLDRLLEDLNALGSTDSEVAQ